jgi:hypothetical protein
MCTGDIINRYCNNHHVTQQQSEAQMWIYLLCNAAAFGRCHDGNDTKIRISKFDVEKYLQDWLDELDAV